MTGGAPDRAGVGIRLVAVDLDGVVYRGGVVLPAAPKALGDVLRRGLDLRYVSNNSTAHREVVSARLVGMGVPAGAERILTSGFVTGRWLRERLPEGAPVMVVGEAGLMRELREAGFNVFHAGEPEGIPAGLAREPAAEAPRSTAGLGASVPGAGGAAAELRGSAILPGVSGPPAAVVVGMDRAISFKILTAAQRAVMDGALFAATNQDATFPTPEGLVPGAGAIVAAVATAAGAEPVLMGKPSLALAQTLERITGVPPSQTLFIGDRLETDIAMGRAAGMITALVLTGVTSAADLEKARGEAALTTLPDYVLADLGELPALLDRLAL